MSLTHSNFQEKFKFLRKEKLLRAIESLKLTEKVVFYFFTVIFAFSAIFLMTKANEHFMTEVPDYGGVIKEGVIGYPRYINPLLPITDSGRDLTSLIYSGLLKTDHNGELVNDLAETYTISEDRLTYTFTLKKDAVFHDGFRVTSNDIAFTLKKVLDPSLKSPKAVNWSGVTIETVDDRTVKFILKTPYAPFIENFTLRILPEHIWKDVDGEGFVFSQFNFEPIGSGPYKIKDIKRNSSGLPTYYHLVAFDKYVLGKPYIKDIYIYFFTDEQKLIDAYKSGVINSLNSISPFEIDSMQKKGEVIHVALPRIFGLFFNQNESSLFLSKEVRQALSLSVDKTGIINQVLNGYGTRITGPIPSQISNIKDTEINAQERIDKAKEMLAKAGWKLNSNNVLSKEDKKNTIELSFSISTVNTPDLKKTAELLKTTWEQLGAVVDIKIFDLADLQQNVIRPRKYEALLFGEVIGRELDLFAFWHSSERNDPGLNLAMYTNSKVDRLLEQGRQSKSYEEKISNLQSIEKIIVEDVPAIFLYSPSFIYIVPKELKGLSLVGLTSASERFANIDQWYIETDKIWNFFKVLYSKENN